MYDTYFFEYYAGLGTKEFDVVIDLTMNEIFGERDYT